MIGYLLAFGSAFFNSLQGTFSKISMEQVDKYFASWAYELFSAFLLALVFFFVPLPTVAEQYWVILGVKAVLTVAANVLYMQAVQQTELSIAIPMIAFTPVFLLITGPIMVGEFPSAYGLIGVLFVAFGTYFLKAGNDLLAPIKALFNDKGAMSMLGVAFIWSITSNIDKMGVVASSPLFYTVTVSAATMLLLLPITLWKSDFTGSLPKIYYLIPVGLFFALTMLLQMAALEHLLVVYVNALKRFSIVLSVVWGSLFFGEERIREKLTGTLIMFLGIILIIFS